MQNKTLKIIKATILAIIVAFFIVMVICFISVKFGKEKFQMATKLIDMTTIQTDANVEKKAPVLQTFEEEQATILRYGPDYGENYATLKIPSVKIELPIYYGKTMDLLKNGVGHDNSSYFPGEGGSVVMMGHNYSRLLGKLPNVKIGDSVQVVTNYGEFNYTIYQTQVVEETETNKVPIQAKEEILMIYTCWPINNIGYATQRFVVYAK